MQIDNPKSEIRNPKSDIRHPLLALAVLLVLTSCASKTVTVVHFTDYHSHAVPFYADGERDTAGIARAVAYIEPLSKRDDVLVFNGGDTINNGAPAWSDKFNCIEWPWWNGITAAMAFGNHDADYGATEFRRCAASVDYPILSGNMLDGDGRAIFKSYAVFTRKGHRIGVFALAGADFASLVKPGHTPADPVTYTPRTEAARAIVKTLRENEHVDAVLLIGHAHNQDDEQLARDVPGIDVVLGTHSHRTEELHRIPGTSTWMVASGQYLERLSRVELRFSGHRLTGVTGGLVRMSHALPEDPATATKVAALQAELEIDPKYAPLFVRLANLQSELSIDAINDKAAPFGSFVMDTVRVAVKADVALSTSSSFRAALPAGEVREADLLDALPYENAVLRCEMTGAELAALLDRAVSYRGTDSFAQLSGVSLATAARENRVGDEPIDPRATYSVATTDYLAKVSGYKDLFEAKALADTGLKVRELVRQKLLAQR